MLNGFHVTWLFSILCRSHILKTKLTAHPWPFCENSNSNSKNKLYSHDFLQISIGVIFDTRLTVLSNLRDLFVNFWIGEFSDFIVKLTLLFLNSEFFLPSKSLSHGSADSIWLNTNVECIFPKSINRFDIWVGVLIPLWGGTLDGRRALMELHPIVVFLVQIARWQNHKYEQNCSYSIDIDIGLSKFNASWTNRCRNGRCILWRKMFPDYLFTIFEIQTKLLDDVQQACRKFNTTLTN